MKKILFSLGVVAALQMNAQVTLFQDSFEAYQDFDIAGIGQWMVWDVDGRPTYIGGVPDISQANWPNAGAAMAFQIFNPVAAGVQDNLDGETTDFSPRTGNKYAACWDAVPGDGVTGNNDWLITPAISLGDSGNVFSFYVQSLSPDYGLEKYKVGIYVGSNPTSPSDFTILSGGTPKSAPAGAWTLDQYNLDNYKNKTVRLAINCVSSDNYMLKVDDVAVTTTSLGTAETSANKGFSVYLNPATGLFEVKSKKDIVKLEVYSMDGKLATSPTASKSINLNGKPAGVYTVRALFKDGQNAIQKIIKK